MSHGELCFYKEVFLHVTRWTVLLQRSVSTQKCFYTVTGWTRQDTTCRNTCKRVFRCTSTTCVTRTSSSFMYIYLYDEIWQCYTLLHLCMYFIRVYIHVYTSTTCVTQTSSSHTPSEATIINLLCIYMYVYSDEIHEELVRVTHVVDVYTCMYTLMKYMYKCKSALHYQISSYIYIYMFT